MRRTRALLLTVSCIGLLQAWSAGRAGAVVLNNDVAPDTAAAANTYDTGNTYANVVAIQTQSGGLCTGTLINSRTILTAAHCFYNQQTNTFAPDSPITVKFGPNASVPTSTVGLSVEPTYSSGGPDIAVLTLSSPVTAITPATVVGPNNPKPQVGSLMVTVGYGQYGTGLDAGAYTNNNPVPDAPTDPIRRRLGETLLGIYGSWTFPTAPPAPAGNVFIAQFRDPQSPAAFDIYGLTTKGFSVPSLQAGNGGGDSGGPLFLVEPDGSLVLIGDLALLTPDTASLSGTLRYGTIMGWTSVQDSLAWLNENNPLREVTAASGNFNWSNPAAWIDSVSGSIDAVPNNQDGSFAAPFGDPGRFFDVTLSNPGTITLDMDPTIDTLAIAGTQSRLVLPAGFTLTTVLSTTLSDGTLTMTGGTLASPEMLISGGLLAGNGTIIAGGGNTDVCSTGVCNTGGTVMPIGTLAIQGNYTQTGGLLAYQLSPGGASGTLAVQGTATLGGTLGVTVLPGLYALSTQYAVLTASSVNGQFAQVSSSMPSIFLSVATTYNPTSVDLTVNRTPFGAVPGESVNQRAVGNALEAAYATSLTGQQAAFYLSVLASPSTNILTELSGESNTGAERAAFQLTNEFLTLMLDPFVNGRGYAPGPDGGGPALGFAPDGQTSLPPDTALAYASIFNKAPPKPTFEQRWTAWGSAYGGSNSANGSATIGSNNVTANAFGFAGGMDYHFSPTTTVGFALAGAGTNWGLADALGSGRSDAFQAGAYGISWVGPAYVAGALAFSNHWFTTSRSVLGDQLTANFDGQSYGARIEGGYRYAVLPAFGVTPYGAVQFQDFHTPAYSESQSDLTRGGFGLSFNAMNATNVRTELGSRFDAPTLVYGKPLVLYGRVAWAHDFGSNPALSAAFQTLPGANFTVFGAPIAHDSALTTAGAQLLLTPNCSLIAKFDGEFGSGSQTYAGSGTLRYTW